MNPNRQVSPNLPPSPPLRCRNSSLTPYIYYYVTFHVNWGPDNSGHLPATLYLPLNLSPTWTLLKCAFAQSLKSPLCPSSGSKKKKNASVTSFYPSFSCPCLLPLSLYSSHPCNCHPKSNSAPEIPRLSLPLLQVFSNNSFPPILF